MKKISLYLYAVYYFKLIDNFYGFYTQLIFIMMYFMLMKKFWLICKGINNQLSKQCTYM